MEESLCKPPTLLSLPAEIRMHILEYIFDDQVRQDGFRIHKPTSYRILDEAYSANHGLRLLLACRQMYIDGSFLAYNQTNFVLANLFGDVPERLSTLRPKQICAVRNIAFVADARRFRKVVDWGQQPFDLANMSLDTLTIVLHCSSFWHYLNDFTSPMVKLLRRLGNVRRLVIVRNNARVKGSFKTWYNRLIGLMMKIDHYERYDRQPPDAEQVWWTWSFDEVAQVICLEAQQPKPTMDEESYMEMIQPFMEALKLSIEGEEWNPDPRSRNGT